MIILYVLGVLFGLFLFMISMFGFFFLLVMILAIFDNSDPNDHINHS